MLNHVSRPTELQICGLFTVAKGTAVVVIKIAKAHAQVPHLGIREFDSMLCTKHILGLLPILTILFAVLTLLKGKVIYDTTGCDVLR